MKSNKIIFNSLFGALLIMFGLAGCGQKQTPDNQTAAVPSSIKSAIAVIYPTKGNMVNGVVTFTKVANGIKVSARLTGLTPGKHGFHIHENGDCSSEDGTSAGGHFNPMHMQHGAPTDAQRHEGDFGNIMADSTGNAILEWVDPMIAFEGPNSIIGRAVIVHASEDDLVSQPSGAAGARIGCGVIGVQDGM